MCTLAVFHRVSDRYPVIIAANRDEFFNRPSKRPARLDDPAGVVAGLDAEAGGTWLGARVDGGFLGVGLLNRRPEAMAPGSPAGARSRGILALGALASSSVDEAVARIESDDIGSYGPFNLVLIDAGEAIVLDNGGGEGRTVLDRGLSVLTNLDARDPRCPRRAAAAERFEELLPEIAADPEPERLVELLAGVLGDHEAGIEPSPEAPFSRVCVHADGYGTRSSSVIVLDADGAVSYFHADGPPCKTAFEQVAF